jgi:hypothetical protein
MTDEQEAALAASIEISVDGAAVGDGNRQGCLRWRLSSDKHRKERCSKYR